MRTETLTEKINQTFDRRPARAYGSLPPVCSISGLPNNLMKPFT